MTPVGFAIATIGGLAIWAGLTGKNIVHIFSNVIGAANPVGDTPPAGGTVPGPSSSPAAAGRPASLTLGDGTGPSVVSAAARYLGVPYTFGGTDPGTGFDCSGFVQRVYADLGVALPRTSEEQARVGTQVPYSQAQPGDLLFFDNAGHVAIYAGGGMMLSADHTGTVVQSEPVWPGLEQVRRPGPPPPPAALPASSPTVWA